MTNIKTAWISIAIISLTISIFLFFYWGGQHKLNTDQACSIGGPGTFPIDTSRDLSNVKKSLSIIQKLHNDINISKSSKFCVKKLKQNRDGALDCYLAKNVENDLFIKICFAPLGHLFSLELQE